MFTKERIPYIIIIALILILLLREGCNMSDKNNSIKAIAEYKTEAKHYKGLNGVDVAQNKALMLDNQEQIKALLNKNDTLSALMKKYKNLKNVTIINNSTQIFNDSIPYDTIRIPCDFKPFQVIRDSSHYQFVGTVAPKYFKIDSLTIPDEQSIVFGKRKMGFLKRAEWTTEVVHSNPLINTTNIGSYSIQENRKKVVLSVGASYGLNLATGTLQPVIGLNLGFPLIIF
jgi:glutaredoxin-related protein